MKKTYFLMILRSVYRTKSRFLSILAIVAVGVGFLGGLLSTAPDMQLTADKYYDDYRFFDIDVKGTMGLTDDDADELSKLECVDRAMPARVTDVNLDCSARHMSHACTELTFPHAAATGS